MIRDVGGAVGRNAGFKAGEAVAKEIFRKCPKNEKGILKTTNKLYSIKRKYCKMASNTT